MAWILLLLSALCFGILCLAKSVALGFVSMVLALMFLVASFFKLLASRVVDNSRDTARILTSEELRQFREQADLKRSSSAAPAESSNTTPPPADNPPPSASA